MLLAEAELADAPRSLRATVSDLLRDVARGQTDELAHLGSTRVSPEAYLRRAEAKTGALYELAARLGAAAGGLGARETDAVATFAAKLGLAFQLADDVRDLVGGLVLGRPAGTDLCVGVHTLPVLATVAGRHPGGDRLRLLLAEVETGGGVEACVDLLACNGALECTAHMARALASEATQRLDGLGSTTTRKRLEIYAAELLGPLPLVRQVSWPGGSAATPTRPATREACLPTSADLALACHPTIPARLTRLRRRVVASGPLAQVVTIAAAIVWLADDIEEVRDDPEAGVVTEAHRRTVATIDLLVADLFAAFAVLPERLVAPVTGRIIDFLLRRVESACRRRSRGTYEASSRGPADCEGSVPTLEDPA
jgi:hypothetical protein